MLYNAISQDLLTDVQVIPKQWPPEISPTSSCTEHDVIWFGRFFLSARVSCPGCVSSHLLVVPILLASRAVCGADKSLTTAWQQQKYQHYSQSKFETENCTSLRE